MSLQLPGIRLEAVNRTRIAAYIYALLTALLLAPTVSGGALSAAIQSKNPIPDVLVWVDARNQEGHLVSITYAKVIPRDQAENQLSQLLSETGWSAANVDISDESLSASGESPMTSIAFMTPKAIELDSGTLPIEPIVKPLRNLKVIRIIYLAPSGFRFRGLEDYENKYVKISLERGTNTYEYTVTVKNAHFDTLGLPLTGVKQIPTEARRSRPGTLALSLVIALALLTGVLTYLVTRRVARPDAGNRNRRS